VAGQFIAVGNSGSIVASPDTAVWTARTAGGTGQGQGIAFSPSLGMYLAVWAGGQLTKSTDGGLTWTTTSTGITGFNDVIWVEDLGVFVITRASSGLIGGLYTTSDGVTLTHLAAGLFDSVHAVWAADKSLLVVTANSPVRNGMWYSSDAGASWTEGTISNTSSAYNTIAYSEPLSLFTVGITGNDRNVTSTNGTSWTFGTLTFLTTNAAMLWVPALSLFLRGGGDIWTAPDGVTWTTRDTASSTYFAYSPDLDLLVSVGGGTRISTDHGVTWSAGGASGAVAVCWGDGPPSPSLCSVGSIRF
jgi:hypothetical protein